MRRRMLAWLLLQPALVSGACYASCATNTKPLERRCNWSSCGDCTPPGVRRCSLTRVSKFGHVQVLLCHQNAATIDTVPLERLRRLHRVRPRYLTSPSAVGKMRASLSLQVATLVDAVQLDRLCRLH